MIQQQKNTETIFHDETLECSLENRWNFLLPIQLRYFIER